MATAQLAVNVHGFMEYCAGGVALSKLHGNDSKEVEILSNGERYLTVQNEQIQPLVTESVKCSSRLVYWKSRILG